MEDTQKLINEDSSSGTEITPSSSACAHSAVSIDSKSVKINDDSSKKNLKKIRSALFKCISEDPVGADAKWNLFIAACQSYRYDSCLKPFPPMFLKAENEKDINALLNTIDGIPSFMLLEKFLSVSDNVLFNENMLHLLHWVLVQMHDPSLTSVPKEKFNEVLSLAPSELNAQKPDYIFKLKYSENTQSYTKWQNYKRSYKTLYAYHGSRLENFHSIIHYGLQLSFTKTPLFGQGVYLSSELLVSLPYSSTGFGWGKSALGGELSVVALCEILDHPSTHCQTKGTKDKNRALANDSMAGEVPHKYYVVSNSELIRIQYLLVYSRSLPEPVGVHPSSATHRESIFGWMRDHKLLTAIMGYVFLLASVGLSNNQHVLRYYKMFLNKAGLQ